VGDPGRQGSDRRHLAGLRELLLAQHEVGKHLVDGNREIGELVAVLSCGQDRGVVSPADWRRVLHESAQGLEDGSDQEARDVRHHEEHQDQGSNRGQHGRVHHGVHVHALLVDHLLGIGEDLRSVSPEQDLDLSLLGALPGCSTGAGLEEALQEALVLGQTVLHVEVRRLANHRFDGLGIPVQVVPCHVDVLQGIGEVGSVEEEILLEPPRLLELGGVVSDVLEELELGGGVGDEEHRCERDAGEQREHQEKGSGDPRPDAHGGALEERPQRPLGGIGGARVGRRIRVAVCGALLDHRRSSTSTLGHPGSSRPCRSRAATHPTSSRGWLPASAANAVFRGATGVRTATLYQNASLLLSAAMTWRLPGLRPGLLLHRP
jgi:hypothetical protein